jgi:hypothetical protein
MRQLHLGAQRHVPQMRYVREHYGVFVRSSAHEKIMQASGVKRSDMKLEFEVTEQLPQKQIRSW